MAWISGYVRFEKPSKDQHLYTGDICLRKAEHLIFYGLLTDADRRTPVSGALVNVFARYAGGKEMPLSHSYSSSDGHYLVSVDKKRIPAGTAAIIVRAVVNNL